MEEDAVEREEAEDRAKVKAGADRVEAAWVVPVRRVLSVPASVRNAAIRSHMSAVFRACRSSARSAGLR